MIVGTQTTKRVWTVGKMAEGKREFQRVSEDR